MDIKDFICPQCNGIIFRRYYSRDILQCDNCLKEYKLSEISEIEIKHQRG